MHTLFHGDTVLIVGRSTSTGTNAARIKGTLYFLGIYEELQESDIATEYIIDIGLCILEICSETQGQTLDAEESLPCGWPNGFIIFYFVIFPH